MTWTVSRTGIGEQKYDDVKVGEGGALICYQTRGEKPFPNATAELEIRVPVALYGPGMWVSAELDES